MMNTMSMGCIYGNLHPNTCKILEASKKYRLSTSILQREVIWTDYSVVISARVGIMRGPDSYPGTFFDFVFVKEHA